MSTQNKGKSGNRKKKKKNRKLIDDVGKYQSVITELLCIQGLNVSGVVGHTNPIWRVSVIDKQMLQHCRYREKSVFRMNFVIKNDKFTKYNCCVGFSLAQSDIVQNESILEAKYIIFCEELVNKVLSIQALCLNT